jgi:eukaryotic-like serine/threonine-protein kinase
MQNLEWLKIKEVFNQTLDLPGNKRDIFLANYDFSVQKEVRELLISHEEAEEFINEPAAVEFGLSQDLNIGQTIADYKIIAPIGVGGMGSVYLAERIGFEQKVAIKLIKRGMDTRAVLKRFKLERQILSKLNHPNIAKLLDGGETPEGLPYFALEYIEGETIVKFCENHQFDVNERLELFQKVCDAVNYAHKNLIVHRDIKPSNIIVTSDGTPKLLDFGIAKLLDNGTDNTATIGRMFTPEYASPEQINGLPITTATDVYSLGVVLYELLSGVRPFTSKSRNYGEIANLILTQEPVRPSSVVLSHSRSQSVNGQTSENQGQKTKDEGLTTFRNPQSAVRNLQGDLDNIILKALRKEPESRYQSASDFSNDISRHLKGLPVTATADSKRYRFTKFVRRHKQGVAISAFVSLLIFAISGIAIYQGIAAVRERDKANRRFEKLRDTAKLLMNDTRDSLFKIPGTISVRNILTAKSVDLLDSLYDESSTDVDFLSELAASYEKLCNSQNWQLRDFANAEKSGNKAVEIRRKIITLEPNNLYRKAELAVALNALNEVFSTKDDRETMLEYLNESESIFRELVEKEPTNQHLESLGNHLIAASGNFKQWKMNAEYEKYQKEGGEILQKLIDSYQGRDLTPQEKTSLAWHLMWQGGTFVESGNESAALANFQQAAELAENAYKADNSIQLAFNHAGRSHRDLGDIYAKRGDYQKAYERYRFSFDWLKSRENDVSRIKANNLYGISFYANRCALMLNKLGRQTEAEEIIAKPWKNYSAFLDGEENAAALFYSFEPLDDLTKFYKETNRYEKAVEVWQNHYNRVQKFLDKNPDDIGFINYQVWATDRMGDVYSASDENSKSFKTNDKLRLMKAKLRYQKAVELYGTMQKLYPLTQSEKDNFRKIEMKIAKTDK